MPVASVTATSSDTISSFKQTSLYQVQKLFSRNAFTKICAVAVAAAPLVFITGAAYRAATGVPMHKAMFKTYTVLQDTPGADATGEESSMAALVINATHVVGLFTYALILGIVADDVQQTVEGFKRGNTAVVERGHTIVLNTNRTTDNLLRQWAKAQVERGRRAPIVLLADRPKEELEALVAGVKAETGLDVLVREGAPTGLDALALVSAADAATVIVMDPAHGLRGGDGAAGAHEVQPYAATLVSLAAAGADGARVVLQAPSNTAGREDHYADALAAAVRLYTDTAAAGGSRVVSVDSLQSLREAKTQCAVSPGLGKFYNAVFAHSADSPEVYCAQFSSADGKTFREVRHMFKNASLLGYYREPSAGSDGAGAGVCANCADDVVLRGSDWLFGLAYDQAHFQLGRAASPGAPVDWKPPAHVPSVSARNIVVAAFDAPNAETMQALADSVPRGGCVTIIAEADIPRPQGPFRVRQIRGHPASTRALEAAGVGSADSVLIAGLHTWDDTEADIQVLSSANQLADVCAARGRERPLHIVAEARGPLLEDFAGRLQALQARRAAACGSAGAAAAGTPLLTMDILPTEELSAGFMAQCAMQPQLATILKELFDVQGAAVALRHPAAYLAPGEALPLSALEDRSRSVAGELVVGATFADGSGRVLVNADEVVRYDETLARLMVLTS